VSLAQVGDTVYVLDALLKYLLDPEPEKRTPSLFIAFAVKLPQ
jgi:hypothetical protein